MGAHKVRHPFVLICPLALHGGCDSHGFKSVQQLGAHIRTRSTNPPRKIVYSGSKGQAMQIAHNKLYNRCLEQKYMTDAKQPSVSHKAVADLHLVRLERQFTEFRQGLLRADQLDVVQANDDAMW